MKTPSPLSCAKVTLAQEIKLAKARGTKQGNHKAVAQMEDVYEQLLSQTSESLSEDEQQRVIAVIGRLLRAHRRLATLEASMRPLPGPDQDR